MNQSDSILFVFKPGADLALFILTLWHRLLKKECLYSQGILASDSKSLDSIFMPLLLQTKNLDVLLQLGLNWKDYMLHLERGLSWQKATFLLDCNLGNSHICKLMDSLLRENPFMGKLAFPLSCLSELKKESKPNFQIKNNVRDL